MSTAVVSDHEWLLGYIMRLVGTKKGKYLLLLLVLLCFIWSSLGIPLLNLFQNLIRMLMRISS